MSTRASGRRVCHERQREAARGDVVIGANLRELGYGG